MKESCSFDELIEGYFFSKTLRVATEWSYRKVLKTFLNFAGAAISPADVDDRLVLNWRRHVINVEGLTKTTWNNKLTHMRALFNFAIEEGYIPATKNPFNGKIARPDVKRKKTLTDIQINEIYLLMEAREADEQYGKNYNYRSALRPAWFWLTVLDALRRTGMRQNQLLHIRLCDVNFMHNWISLRPDRFSEPLPSASARVDDGTALPSKQHRPSREFAQPVLQAWRPVAASCHEPA